MGALSRSWRLLTRSFAVLMSDKELMWLPVISGLFCLCATVIVGAIGLLLVLPIGIIPADPAQQKMLAKQMTPFFFLLYVVTYNIAAYFNVALVSIALDRLAGGHASLTDGLQTAWDRKWSIFQWALLAATVGMLLQTLERRLDFLGRMVTGITGVVWTLASFFVVPVLAVQNVGPAEALSKSAQIYRKAWGEQAVSAFSFAAIVFVFAQPALLLPPLAVFYGRTHILAGIAVAIIYFLLLAVAASAARGVLLAALYRYATTGEVSSGFHLDDVRRFTAAEEL